MLLVSPVPGLLTRTASSVLMGSLIISVLLISLEAAILVRRDALTVVRELITAMGAVLWALREVMMMVNVLRVSRLDRQYGSMAVW